MRKVFFKVLLVIVLWFIGMSVARLTAEYHFTGFQLPYYFTYCDQPFGFPFVFEDEGKVIWGGTGLGGGPGVVHGDCFPQTDYIAYTINFIFWVAVLWIFVLTGKFALLRHKAENRQKEKAP